MEGVTLERVYREIKLLRRDVDHLKKILVPEVEPEQDEIQAVRAGRREISLKKVLPEGEAFGKIKAYVETHPGCLTSDIVLDLEMEPEQVVRILRRLEEQGEVRGE